MIANRQRAALSAGISVSQRCFGDAGIQLKLDPQGEPIALGVADPSGREPITACKTCHQDGYKDKSSDGKMNGRQNGSGEVRQPHSGMVIPETAEEDNQH